MSALGRKLTLARAQLKRRVGREGPVPVALNQARAVRNLQESRPIRCNQLRRVKTDMSVAVLVWHSRNGRPL